MHVVSTISNIRTIKWRLVIPRYYVTRESYFLQLQLSGGSFRDIAIIIVQAILMMMMFA